MPVLLGFLLLSLLVGWWRGGELGRLAKLQIRGGWMVVAGLALQLLLFATPFASLPLVTPSLIAVLHVTTLLLLLVVVFANLALPGMRMVALGLAFNTLVIVANGGFMPASPQAILAIGAPDLLEALRTQGHLQKSILMTEATRFPLLADVIPLPPPYPRPTVISVGDLLSGLGAGFLIYRTMVGKGAAMPSRDARPR